MTTIKMQEQRNCVHGQDIANSTAQALPDVLNGELWLILFPLYMYK